MTDRGRSDPDANKVRDNRRRHDRIDLESHYGDMQREMNALRSDFRNSTIPDITAMLQKRFSELDHGTIASCAEAISAGRMVELTPPAPRPVKQQGFDRNRRR